MIGSERVTEENSVRMRPWWLRPAPCRRTHRDLQAYLDGEVGEDVAWAVARHLADCDDCYGEADAIRSVKNAVRKLGVAPDPEVVTRLRSLLQRDPPEGP